LAPPLVAELFGLTSHGVILGCLMICAEGGSAIGPVVAGHIFDVTGSYSLAFLIYAIIGVTGLIMILLLKPAGKEVKASESGRSA